METVEHVPATRAEAVRAGRDHAADLVEAGDLEGAEALLHQLVAAWGDDAGLLSDLAVVAAAAGHTERAGLLLHLALRLDPLHPDADANARELVAAGVDTPRPPFDERWFRPADGSRLPPPPLPAGVEPTLSAPVCQAATYGQTREPAYWRWAVELRSEGASRQRKLWEWVFICRVFELAGVLEPGRRGIGYGVGTEPLSAVFANRGCRVTATDLPPEQTMAGDWSSTNQHAATLADLNARGLCPPDRFAELVEFRPLDMNALPELGGDHDFAWSSCVVEHLGTPADTEKFLLDSLAALKPGGVAVHTTEMSIVDVEEPMSTPGTLVFTPSWARRLQERVEAQGDRMDPLNFCMGRMPEDALVDHRPYNSHPHMKMVLDSGVATTSFGLVFRKG